MKNISINCNSMREQSTAYLVNVLTNKPAADDGKVCEPAREYETETNINAVLESMTPAKRKIALAGIELYKRHLHAVNTRKSVRSSTDIYNLVSPLLSDLQHEEVYAGLLDLNLKVIKIFQVSKGGISSSIVDIRLILKEALKNNATHLFLSHNHPSGGLRPSKEDDRITERLKEAAKLLDLKLLDHVIVTSSCYYSYADESKL